MRCRWRLPARCGDSSCPTSTNLSRTMSMGRVGTVMHEPARCGMGKESGLGAAVRMWQLMLARRMLHGWLVALGTLGGSRGRACGLQEVRFAARSCELRQAWVACWHVSAPVQQACSSSSGSRSCSTTDRCLSSSSSMEMTRMESRSSARVRSRAAAAAGWTARTSVAHAQECVEIVAWRSANYACMQGVFGGVKAAQAWILGRMFRCWVQLGQAVVMR